MMRSRLYFFALAVLAWSTAARADTYFNIDDNLFACDENTFICYSSYTYGLEAVVGVDTVYASDGVTVLETLTDVVLESALGPTIANDIATDTGNQPPQLQDNLAPFTTLTDVQFAEDNEFPSEDPAGCPLPPTEMLTQSGSLITGVSFEYEGTDSMGDPIYTSPSIYTDLTGAVSGATVTSDSVSNAGADIYSYHLPVSAPVCSLAIPAGYSAVLVNGVAITTSIENITETEDSSAPEPASWALALAGVALLILRRRW